MSETRVNWPSLLEDALTTPGNLYDTYSRFHSYSLANMMLFRQQGYDEPMASMKAWNQLKRRVKLGAHAGMVIVPKLIKEPPVEGETQEEKKERIARLVGFKPVNGVFGYSQTTGEDIPPRPTPGWDLITALGKLGISERPFDQPDGNMQGCSIGLEFAINPMAVNRTKTVFHELGHILLGHTLGHGLDGEHYHRGIQEFQAESVAYLAMNELGLLDEDTATRSRGYIQHWLGEERPPDKAIQQVFTAADRILRSGRVEVSGEAEAPPDSL